MNLKEVFRILFCNYSQSTKMKHQFWNELEANYTDKGRYYHNLHHLENIYQELLPIKKQVHNWDIVLFTLFYHDSIYNSQRQDNEEKSAVLAEERMKTLDVPRDLIDLCSYQIRATKSHVKSDNQDTNYFTDADLSILGKTWDEYSIYTQNVRKEYAIYPDLIYKKGRKKVLKHFLEMERIYKTDYFYQKYEEKAKLNMQRELELL